MGVKMDNIFNTAEEILDFAIEREQEAARFYSEICKRPLPAEIKEKLASFYKTELDHKDKLEKVKREEVSVKSESISSLGLAELVEDGEIRDDTSVVELLAIAMKKEDRAYRLYIDLGIAATTPEFIDLFLFLAQEEAKHRLWLETEYKKRIEQEILSGTTS
jgi:rubrerythrin